MSGYYDGGYENGGGYWEGGQDAGGQQGGYQDGGYYDEGYERSPVTPDEIERQGFTIEHRGYDRDQVRGFLYEVAAALRLAMQGNRSTVFGPPPTWSHGPADYKPQPPAPEVNTRILRAHLSASLRQEAELDTDGEAILERARHDAKETLRQAEAAADEVLTEAEDEAEELRERARRMLAAAQEEAESVVAEAEARARRVLKGARQDALNHAQQVSTTLEARADQLVEAEQSTLHRLNEARRQLSKLIEELAGADPVVGPTIEILRLAVDARTTGEPSVAGPPITTTEVEPSTPRDKADHPVNTMVRNAVARAMDAAADEEPVTGSNAALPPAPEPTTSYRLGPETPDPGPATTALAMPPARAGRSARPPGDLRDLLSELADIVAEEDEPELDDEADETGDPYRG